jgi:acetolactate synthase small subunit
VSPTPTYQPPEPQRSGLLTALMAGALIALVAANIYLYVQIDHLRTDVATVQEKLTTQLSNLRDAANVNTEAQRRHIETLKEELEAARAQARSTAGQAKAESLAYADKVAKQLQMEQAKVQQQVSTEISGVKSDVAQVATTANAKIADVSTDLGTVKTQASQTQAELQKTISDLKSVRGDLGLQSGLIATNGNELAALKLRGERNYFDIKLGKTKQPQRVGDITLLLKNTDPKKNKSTVQVMADDKLTEKKDKSINEPVQFLTAKGGRIPYEIVINKVEKNMIVGYLATPKVEVAR